VALRIGPGETTHHHAAAADDTSSATLGDAYGEIRFEFADAIVVHLLGFKLPEQEDELRDLVRPSARPGTRSACSPSPPSPRTSPHSRPGLSPAPELQV
jgi:hypothetical protein